MAERPPDSTSSSTRALAALRHRQRVPRPAAVGQQRHQLLVGRDVRHQEGRPVGLRAHGVGAQLLHHRYRLAQRLLRGLGMGQRPLRSAGDHERRPQLLEQPVAARHGRRRLGHGQRLRGPGRPRAAGRRSGAARAPAGQDRPPRPPSPGALQERERLRPVSEAPVELGQAGGRPGHHGQAMGFLGQGEGLLERAPRLGQAAQLHQHAAFGVERVGHELLLALLRRDRIRAAEGIERAQGRALRSIDDADVDERRGQLAALPELSAICRQWSYAASAAP